MAEITTEQKERNADGTLKSATAEDVRKFWDSRPCNIRHSPKEVGTYEYFEDVARRKYFVESHIKDFAQFDKWKGKRVLEIGCGIGTAMISFLQAGVASYTGIDISSESLLLANKRFKVYQGLGLIPNTGGDPNQCILIQADIETLPQEGLPIPKNIEDRYDLIYSFGVLHHTPNIARAMGNLKYYAKPGAELKIMLYAKTSWKHIMIQAGLDQYEAQNNAPVADVFSISEVVDLCDYAEFDVEDPKDIYQTHIFPYKIPEYKKYEYVLEPYFAAMPASMFRALESRLGWHICCTAIFSPRLPRKPIVANETAGAGAAAEAQAKDAELDKLIGSNASSLKQTLRDELAEITKKPKYSR